MCTMMQMRNPSRFWMYIPPGSAVIKHQNPARANMPQDCEVKADYLLQSIHTGEQHIYATACCLQLPT